MRDWRSGEEWDTRTLWELDGWRLVITCTWCRRIAYIAPWTVRHKQPSGKHWRNLQCRFKCVGCERKAAKVRVEPIPIVNHPSSPPVLGVVARGDPP